MKIFTLMQSVIFHGTFDSISLAMEATQGIVSNVKHWPNVHSFVANGKKWHVYETTLNEKVNLD